MFTGDTKLTELLNSYLVSIFSTKKDHLNLERTEQKSLNPNWSPVSIWTSVVRKYWTTLNESFQPQTNCIQGTEWAWKSDQTQYWSSLRNHHTQGKKSHTKNFKDTSILPKGEKCEFLKFLNIKVEFGLLENTWTHWFYTHTHTHTHTHSEKKDCSFGSRICLKQCSWVEVVFVVLVAQLCWDLCDPKDCSLPGSSVHGFLQAKLLSGLPFSSLGDLPNPGIKLRSLALQADFLLSEPPGKP